MMAAAATWGAGVPAASQSMGMSPSEGYDMATPSLTTSAMIGFMEQSHKRGLRSGGLVGYSTFFTGYDPGRHGFARQISLGRMGAKGVEMAAKGLMATPLGSSEAARYVAPFARAGKYGVGGAMDAAFGGGVQSVTEARQGVYDDTMSMLRDVASSNRFGNTPGVNAGTVPQHRTAAKSVWNMGYGGVGSPGRLLRDFNVTDFPSSADEIADVRVIGEPSKTTVRSVKNLGGVSASRAAASNARNTAVSQKASSWYRWMVGVLGGEGYKKGGTQSAVREVTEEIGEHSVTFTVAKGGTDGAVAATGTLGKWAGRALRGAGWYEAARLGAQAGSYAIGSAYESMVETTARLQQRVGHQQEMSPAYYNRAAATERQRAVRELNESVLNPRTQLRGNEASFYHR